MNDSLFSLNGKTALVTGGNGGLGRAIASGFRAIGARVPVTGRDATKNESARAELGDEGAVFELDAYDENAVRDTVARVQARFGLLHILVNCAGNTRGGPLVSLSRADWELVGAAVLFASRASSFITGTQLVVDGGLSLSDRLFDD